MVLTSFVSALNGTACRVCRGLQRAAGQVAGCWTPGSQRAQRRPKSKSPPTRLRTDMSEGEDILAVVSPGHEDVEDDILAVVRLPFLFRPNVDLICFFFLS